MTEKQDLQNSLSRLIECYAEIVWKLHEERELFNRFRAAIGAQQVQLPMDLCDAVIARDIKIAEEKRK